MTRSLLALLLALLLLPGCYRRPLGGGDDDDDSGAGDDDSASGDDDAGDDDAGDDDAGDDDAGDDDAGDDDTAPDCQPEGATTCLATSFRECSGGTWQEVELCVDPTPLCDAVAGCLACAPGSTFCENNVAMECAADGMSSTVLEDCADDTCLAGGCLSECDMVEQQFSYLGCSFLSVSTANLVEASFDNDFAVVVGNPDPAQAVNVTVSRGGSVVTTTSVPAGATQAIELPMVLALKNAQETVLAAGGAYEVSTDLPVVAYQYNPLHFQLSAPSYTNDASLLLPEHVLTGNYMVSTWPTWGGGEWTDLFGTPLGSFDYWYPGFAAIVATVDNTVVTLNSSAVTMAGGGLNALSPGGTGQVTLNRGDVLQVFSERPNPPSNAPWNYCSQQGWTASEVSCPPTFFSPCDVDCLDDDGDLTGSVISATEPVAVFGGHLCSNVPHGAPACDHLEEMMFPTETWGVSMVMTAPVHPDGSGVAPTRYRILALNAGTSVSFAPAVHGSVVLGAGEFVEFESGQDFVVTASDRVYVTQFMQGQQHLDASRGDPAMGSGIPWLQVRSDYDFLTPDSYEANYVNVVAQDGSGVQLDGAPVTGFAAIGSTGWEVARVQLQPGSHHIESSSGRFGITTYGYASFTSYLYPGGLNFTR